MSSWHLAHLAEAIPAGDYRKIAAPQKIIWQAQPIILDGDALVGVAYEGNYALPMFTVPAGQTIEQACTHGLSEQLGVRVAFERLLYVHLSDWHMPRVIFHPLGRVIGGELHAERIALDQLTQASIMPTDITHRLQSDIQTPPTRALYLGTSDTMREQA